MTRSPPASLTRVKLRRGPRSAEVGKKAGDITTQLLTTALPPPASAPAVPGPLAPAKPDAGATTAAPIDVAPARRIAPVAWAALQAPFAPLGRHGYGEFVDYWNRLRRGGRLPTLALLDRELVAGRWPDSLMVSFATVSAAMPQIARLSRATGEIEYTPMVTDWIISCARQVAQDGEVMEDEQEFPLPAGAAGYRLLLLPFTTAEGKNGHVVCHLSRSRVESNAQF